MNAADVIVEAGKLAAEGKPYALATVVSVVRSRLGAARRPRALSHRRARHRLDRRRLLRADRRPRGAPGARRPRAAARPHGGRLRLGRMVEVLIEPVVPAPSWRSGTARPRAPWPSWRAPWAGAFATRASMGRTRSSLRPWATATRTSSSPHSRPARATSAWWRAPGGPRPCSPRSGRAVSTRSPCCGARTGRARPGPVLAGGDRGRHPRGAGRVAPLAGRRRARPRPRPSTRSAA